MKRMLITGATGSLGSELVARYHADYELYIQGRDAQRLLKLKMHYPHCNVVLGDLRCHALREAVGCCHTLVHTAAQKYVDLAERYCAYTIDTNIACTHELADLAGRKGVERFVFISTDKSSAPNNVYGMTKYLGERLVLELTDLYNETAYVICRFGNIFGSNGSVIQLWLDSERHGQRTLQVTNPDMTRFMFSLDEAAETVDFALNQGRSGDIIIRKMKSVTLRQIIELFDGFQVRIVGPRPGEKMHETLYVKGETATGYETEQYYVFNRRSTQTLPISSVDSSQVEPVEPRQLRQWFDQVRKQVA